jgi:hypothetical protein
MKNYLLKTSLAISLFVFYGFADAQNIIFEDPNFKARLIILGIDTDGDGEISQEEAKDIISLQLIENNLDITSVQGIEYFTELLGFGCSNSSITTLDVSGNTKLWDLNCYSNQHLVSLNASNNIDLKTLNCRGNKLTTLDLSNNKNLQYLDCKDNQLVYINMKNGINESFYDFSNNPNLAFICVDPSQLAEIQNYVTTNNIGNNPLVTTDCSLYMTTQETTKNKISVYPNPVKDILTIKNEQLKIKSAKIFDMNGKLVKVFSGNSVDVSDLQKGNYLLSIDNQIFKIIKE